MARPPREYGERYKAWLNYLRQKLNIVYGQREFNWSVIAKEAGVARETLAKFADGLTADPRTHTAFKIAEAIGEPFDQFTRSADEPVVRTIKPAKAGGKKMTPQKNRASRYVPKATAHRKKRTR